VKNLYKELLEEAGMNKQFELELKEGRQKKIEFKEKMSEKNNFVAYTRRQIENYRYLIVTMIRETPFDQWKARMKEINDEVFVS
jgi:hypothetical protein